MSTSWFGALLINVRLSRSISCVAPGWITKPEELKIIALEDAMP